MSKVSPILRKAAQLIAEQGLARGSFEDSGKIDVVEAIFRAATGISQISYAEKRNQGIMPITLDQHNKFRFSVITLRNWLKVQGLEDQPAFWADSATQESVIEALRTCADHDEGKG